LSVKPSHGAVPRSETGVMGQENLDLPGATIWLQVMPH